MQFIRWFISSYVWIFYLLPKSHFQSQHNWHSPSINHIIDSTCKSLYYWNQSKPNEFLSLATCFTFRINLQRKKKRWEMLCYSIEHVAISLRHTLRYDKKYIEPALRIFVVVVAAKNHPFFPNFMSWDLIWLLVSLCVRQTNIMVENRAKLRKCVSPLCGHDVVVCISFYFTLPSYA